MSELLPCWSCGGEEAETHVYGATGQWTVKCPCGAEMNRLVYTEAEAIEAWNTRAERTCHNTEYLDGCFTCSEYGKGLEDPRQEPNFVKWCPFCRAKVIDE